MRARHRLISCSRREETRHTDPLAAAISASIPHARFAGERTLASTIIPPNRLAVDAVLQPLGVELVMA